MSEFTFITANDIHITDINPRSRVDDFSESILQKIEQMKVACKKLGADGALIAGDLFHFKPPMKNSHRLVQDLIRMFGDFPCPVYMIEGNHDISENRLESIDKQPLGVLFASGVVKRLRNETIKKGGDKVSLVGVPFSDEFDPDELELPAKEGCLAQICLLHIYASPTPGMLFKERIFGYRELPEGPDFYVIGHYHINQGVVEEGGRHFINIGSLSRGTLTDDALDHKPQLGFIRISNEDGEVTKIAQTINLKVKPPEEVFDLQRRKEEKEETKKIEEFIEALTSESQIEDRDEGESLEEVIQKTKVTQEIKDKAIHFIQAATALKKS